MNNWVWVEGSKHNDPVTGFREFTWGPGMAGLAKVEGTSIHILAMLRTREDPGVLPVFVDMLSFWHARIGIWDIMNPRLRDSLVEMGFQPSVNSFGGELVRGMELQVMHMEDCDVFDRPPEGIVKPCNCLRYGKRL